MFVMDNACYLLPDLTLSNLVEQKMYILVPDLTMSNPAIGVTTEDNVHPGGFRARFDNVKSGKRGPPHSPRELIF